MTLLVKDANTATQAISTQADAAGNIVPVSCPASVVIAVHDLLMGRSDILADELLRMGHPGYDVVLTIGNQFR